MENREQIQIKKRKKRIGLICPICNKTGFITIERVLVDQVLHENGDWMMELQVFAGEICEHEFLVRIDANMQVR